MSAVRGVRRFISTWIACTLALAPVLTFFIGFVPEIDDSIELAFQVVFAFPLAVAFLHREYSLDFLWSFVRMLWTGFLLYVAALLVLVIVVAFAFETAPASPTELGFRGQVVSVIVGGVVYLHLYRSAYRKTIAEQNGTA